MRNKPEIENAPTTPQQWGRTTRCRVFEARPSHDSQSAIAVDCQ